MTDANKSLWKAIIGNYPEGISAAIQSGADLETAVYDLPLTVAMTIRKEFAKPDGQGTAEERAVGWEYLLDGLDTLAEKQEERFSDDTRTPLLVAVLHDFTEVLQALLSAGANPNGASALGLTPLLVAVRRGDLETARTLLQAGADPNQALPLTAHRTRGHSPLVRAAGDGNLALVKLLLEYGAEVNQPDSAGRTALLTACARPYGHNWFDLQEHRQDGFLGAQTIDEVADHAVSYFQNLTKNLPTEPEGEWEPIITLLLENGADIEAETLPLTPYAMSVEICGTPLLQAAQRGDALLVARLLTAGALPRPTCGTTPLHRALASGENEETVQLLLKAGASPTEPDSAGASPINYATHSGNLPGLKLLAEAGVDLFTVGPKFGKTLLHLAAHSGQLEVARYLLDAGLEIDATCSTPSPAEQETERNQLHAQARSHPTERGLPELPTHLLYPSTETGTERPLGITPLMLAAKANNAPMVQFLLERGADPKRKDSNGQSPRDYARHSAAVEDRQRAFMTASQSNTLENPNIKKVLEEVSEESAREEITTQLNAIQENFRSRMEAMLGGKRTAREETLALLPE